MFGEDSVFTSGETEAIKNTGQLVPRGLAAPSTSLSDKFFLQIVNCPFSLHNRFLYRIFEEGVFVFTFDPFLYMLSECQVTSDQWFSSAICFDAIISFLCHRL